MKRKALIAASIGVMALTLVGTVAFGGEHNLIRHEAADSYSLTVTPEDVTVLSNAKSTVETSYGSLITFGHTNIQITGGNFVLEEGTLFNYDDLEVNPDGGALSGLTSITVDIVEGSLTLSYGWETGVWSEDTVALLDNVACDLSDLHPNYFKLSGTATFSTISVLYTCTRGEEPVDNTMTVYVKTYDTWTGVNIWAWGGTGVGNLFAEWPGEPMNYDEELGLYYYDYDTTVYTNVLFTRDTDTNTKTPDLVSPTSTEEDCYVWEQGWFNEDTEVVPVVNDRTIYLADPNKYWNNTGAEFRAWVWGGTGGEKWIYFTDEDADGVFESTVHVSYTDIIFFRSEPGKTGWNGEWGRIQTKLDATKSTFTLSSYSAGSWSN